ncbi:MAG: methyltransferase family protein [Phycisphaerae bacterium]
MRKARILLLRLALVPIILVAVFIPPSWPEGSPVPTFMEGAGYLLLLLGLGIRMWSILFIGGRKSRELVTEGPYSLCRHPLYVGTLLLSLGAALSFENLIMLVTGILFIVPIHAVIARLEEQRLAELFGDRYAEYARRVPRFLPRFSAYRSKPDVLVSVRAIRRAAMDAMAIMLIPLFEDLLETLRTQGLVPVLYHFP